MATALKSKPGITGATTLSIPAEWDATWFRNFINNMLKGADVRNAIAGPGITITGTIASPYATISATSSGALTAPVTINSTTGQVSLTVNAATGQAGIINTGSDIVEQGLQVQGSGTSGFTGPGIELSQTGSVGTIQAYNRTSAAYLPINVNGSTVALQIGGTSYFSIAATGAATLAAPGSGTSPTLTINALNSNTALQLSATTANAPYIEYGINSVQQGYMGFAGAANQLATGSVAGDLVIRAQSGAIDFTTNGGTSIQMQLTTAGALGVNGNIAAGQAGDLTLSRAGATTGAVFFGTSGSKYLYFDGTEYSFGGTGQIYLNADTSAAQFGNPTGGYKGTGTINVSGGYYVNGVAVGGTPTTGTFTGTLTGCTTSPTATFKYNIIGNTVFVFNETALTATSNAATCTITGMPAFLEPTQTLYGTCPVESSGSLLSGTYSVTPGSTTITLGASAGTTGGFAISGTKGLSNPGILMSWSIN